MANEKIDPLLTLIADEDPAGLQELESDGRFGFAIRTTYAGAPERVARVLIRCTEPDAPRLRDAGVTISCIAGDVVSGFLPLSQLQSVEKLTSVVYIEGSRALTPELDLALPESRVDLVHAAATPLRGQGIIVGVIDTGIDWQHVNFRRANGTSRILSIWDQSLVPTATERSPPFGLGGVEYTQADIDAALQGTGIVRHADGKSGHGTHVAGIAVGNGAAVDEQGKTFTQVGVVPEADLIVVAFCRKQAIGDSASAVDASKYILDRAAALKRPVVVNMSQGGNVGAHDGTSVLERAIDNLIGTAGCAFVKSAGNEGKSGRHAQGLVSSGTPEIVNVRINAEHLIREIIDFWYDGADRFSIQIIDPLGNATQWVTAGSLQTHTLPNGNKVRIDSRIGNPNNNDNEIHVYLSGHPLQLGTWQFVLNGVSAVDGRFHAWIDRSKHNPTRFLPPHRSDDCTISIPGTARKAITVGSYVLRGASVGSLSSFSSRGPTRDGRNAPTLVAPGDTIRSARAQGIAVGKGNYCEMRGTSMAAPMVAGTVALMLEAKPTLTQSQIEVRLGKNARSQSGGPPHAWGAGKVDAKKSV
jgi:subtilisin family serine protease